MSILVFKSLSHTYTPESEAGLNTKQEKTLLHNYHNVKNLEPLNHSLKQTGPPILSAAAAIAIKLHEQAQCVVYTPHGVGDNLKHKNPRRFGDSLYNVHTQGFIAT